jgi:hypothetical protein
MPARHRSTALAMLSVVAIVIPVSGFAQADNRVPALLRSSADVVQTYAPASSRVHDDVALPRNLTVSGAYEATVELMRQRSPTFRRQCARIAKAANLTVVLSSEPPAIPRPALAWTRIVRKLPADLHATITISVPSRAVELIAHEMEHIIEQLDGIDLATKAKLEASGVRACACGADEAFETSRAILMGMRVAAEVSANHNPVLTASAKLR